MLSPSRLLFGCLACAFAATSAAAPPADRIWTGTILTMNDTGMRAEAVAVREGRIVAVGAKDPIMKLKGPQTEVVDLGQRALLPGFVDSHGHVMGGGLQALSANLLAPPDGPVNSIAALQQSLRDWMAANSDAIRQANLIVGFGYDNAQLKELRHPTRDDLDAVSKDVPIIVVHQSSHLLALNSKALEMVGFTAATADPPGGVIRRRAGTREPDGVLEETAMFPALGKLLPSIGPKGFKTFARAGAKLWASYGYTTAQDGRTAPGALQLLREVADEGGFEIDVMAYPDVMAARDVGLAQRSATYRNRLRVAGVKLGIDGSPQGFTAWRDRPYYAPVGNYPKGYSGYGNVTVEQANDAVDWAFRNDIQILAHASGERAQDILIAAVDAATEKHGARDRRAVLIHGHFMREDQMDSYARLNVIPSLFPMHTFYWGDWHRDHTVGPALAENITPTGWAAKRGLRFTSHHDAPVAFPDSMRILSATVTRRSRSGDIIGPQQRVDVLTALKAMTIWAAYQAQEENAKGSIEPGKLADFAILSQDPTAIDPEKLATLKVTETVKDGRTIFRRPADAAAKPASDAVAAGAAELLRGFASYREVRAVPGYRLTPPAATVHDGACLSQALLDLGAAMARAGGG
jgi:predicted amidohydrolase YtcJ